MSSGSRTKEMTIRNKRNSVSSIVRRKSSRWDLGIEPSTRRTVETAIVERLNSIVENVGQKREEKSDEEGKKPRLGVAITIKTGHPREVGKM